MEPFTGIMNMSNITTPVYNNHEQVDEVVVGLEKGYAPSEAVVSNEMREMFGYVVEFSLTLILGILGTVGNIISIVVFYKQGYKETINISFTAIALWDLVTCLFGTIYRTRVPVRLLASPALATSYETIATFVFAFPCYYAIYVSSILAAYVAVERCLCVCMPFTVRTLLTPKVVTSVMVILSIVTFFSKAVLYVIERIVWVFHPGLNTTVAMESYTSTSLDHNAFLDYSSVISFLGLTLSFTIQCVCSLIIYSRLRVASRVRAKIMVDGNANKTGEMSTRDRQVIRMLLVIIIVYIVCSLPSIILALAKVIEPQFYAFREYHNLFMSLFYCSLMFSHVNASINIIIYYFMSSQFRTKVRELLNLKKI